MPNTISVWSLIISIVGLIISIVTLIIATKIPNRTNKISVALAKEIVMKVTGKPTSDFELYLGKNGIVHKNAFSLPVGDSFKTKDIGIGHK